MLCLWRTSGPSITLVSQQEIAWKISNKNIPVGAGVELFAGWKFEGRAVSLGLSNLEVSRIFGKYGLG